MDRKKLIISFVLIALSIVSTIKVYIDYNNKNERNKVEITKDEKRFKEEYESLNGKKDSDRKDYLSIIVPEDNNVKYKSADEIVEIMKKDTGIIYFGYNSCPWSRSIIETLTKSASTNNITNLYYVDIKDMRSTYTVERRRLKQTKKGTDGYYEILKVLKDKLKDYTITSNGRRYSTKEKRLNSPTVVAVKDGKIVGFHEGVLDNIKNPKNGLNTEEITELSKIYDEMMEKIK